MQTDTTNQQSNTKDDKSESSTRSPSQSSSTSSPKTETKLSVVPEVPMKKIDDSGKHLLETGWTFWYDKKTKDAKAKSYEENLTEVGTFQTIEDFWSYYTHMKRPEELPKDSNYHLFRQGIKPMWESFPKGGCFIKKVKRDDSDTIGKMWEELLFVTIGELFEDPDVVGVVLSIRPKEDILSIWNKNNSNQSLRYKIGEKLREIWQLDANTPIEYKNHSSSIKDGNTYHSHIKQIYV